ncbi:hypothetical protein MKI84_08000 [Ancylobacter sp. A5.8]|uniref:hypothetical protein n=1 Tax=Ancylobacter gelatini TaxID=2919920 RepID=UPI001F4D374C|nr:hypothetical protein [Ancylobacter gelatini]MCJ8142859.1 hypothetical protein [Ancylobacter gelatini]
MIDLFALTSAFAILCVSALVAFMATQIFTAVLIIGAVVVLAAVAAVNFGWFEGIAPLLVIYANSGLMGCLAGILLARYIAAGRNDEA